jgi:putative ubiquitin-RnfH superfamily antitoxin RatB of RatAB toxin-antitoxin module
MSSLAVLCIVVVLAKDARIVEARRCYGETDRRAVCIVHVQPGVTAADAEKPSGCLVGEKAIDHSTVDCESCPVCVVGLPATLTDPLKMSMI